MRVKICGITNYEDAKVAIDAGADALGFVFYEHSKRFIHPRDAKEIIKKLPPFVEKVALFVNADAQTINSYTQEALCTLAQIHFEADAKVYEQIFLPHLKVVRAKNRADLDLFRSEYRLVDSFSEAYGGSGLSLDLDLFSGVDTSKIILAGGLDPQNVLEVKKLGFYGVDVSSGVEMSAGKKDAKKVREFIANAKS